jgi:hypothetical protein
MFGIVDNRQAEYATGLYFPEYPKPPIKVKERFKYREETQSTRMQDVVTNLANPSNQKTIVTTYKIKFKVEGYVLLGETLYRIMDVNASLTSPQTARILKCPAQTQTLFLNRVSNVSGITI